MASLSKVYSADDWEIQVYVPESGSFVLDFSKLDGTDVLGFTEGSLQAIDAQIANLTISEGSAITQGMFSTISPTTMQAQLIIENFVFTEANKFFIGTECAVYLTNATPSSLVYFGGGTYSGLRTNKTLFFEGFIDSFNVDVVPGSNFANISLTGISKSSRDLNTLIGVEKDTTTPKWQLIANATPATISWDGSQLDNYNFGVTDFEEKTFGDFAADLLMCESGLASDEIAVVYDAQATEESTNFFSINPNQNQQLSLTIDKSQVQTPTVDFDDDNIAGIALDWSGSGSPTGVAFTLYSDTAVTYNYGETNTPGAFVYTATPDVKNLTQLQAVADRMLNFRKLFAPIEITNETARTYQNLEFKEQTVYITSPEAVGFSFWLQPSNLARVTDTITVTNTELGLYATVIVTGRTINVTPDNWTTTYQLWKGFTS